MWTAKTIFKSEVIWWEQDYYDENSDFIFRNEKITMEEYEQLCKDIWG